MNRRNVTAVVSLALLLAAVAVSIFWSAHSHHAVRSFMLPDGTKVSFYQTTYGTNHAVLYATGWRDNFARFVPARFATKLGFGAAVWTPSSASSLNASNLVIWLKRSGSFPLPAAPNRGIGFPSMSATVVDDNGLEAGTLMNAWNGALMAVPLLNYPRRSRVIHLRFWDTSTPSADGAAPPLLAELEIPNPAPSTAPPWVAETLPAVRVTNGLEVSLLKLETGYSASNAGFTSPLSGNLSFFGGSLGRGRLLMRSSGGSGYVPSANSRSYSLAEVKLLENGQPTTGWAVRGLQADTPAGSPAMSLAHSIAVSADPRDYFFTGVLWPEEPVWGVTIEVAREFDFPPEETWRLTGIPIPRAWETQSNSIAVETNMAGMHLIFTGLSPTVTRSFSFGSGTSAPTISPSSSPDSWTLNVTITNYYSDVQFTLDSLQTDTGEVVRRTGSSASISAPHFGVSQTATYQFNFQAPDGVTTMDATFIVSKSRYVTFRVKPTLGH